MREGVILLLLLLAVLAAQLNTPEDEGPVWPPPLPQPIPAPKPEVHDGLEEVNRLRRAHGVAEFERDLELNNAAIKLSLHRAKHLIAGHSDDDFGFLWDRKSADASGVGAAKDEWGWCTCCMLDKYRYAGAAWARGRDGQRYMSIFVRR